MSKNYHFFKLSEYNSFLWANYRSVQSTAVRWTFASPPSSSHSPSWTLSACERMWRGSPAPGPARSILWEHLYRLLKEVIQQIGNYKERKQFVAYLWRVQKRRLSKQKLLNRTAHKWFFDFWVKKQKKWRKMVTSPIKPPRESVPAEKTGVSRKYNSYPIIDTVFMWK